jgi:ParB family chromosome partitioning protein
MESTKEEKVIKIALSKLKDSPYQGRILSTPGSEKGKVDKSLSELARNIREQGLMSPIIVRQTEADVYEIIDGHRRVEAHRMNQSDEIDAIIRAYPDKEAQVFSIVSNLLHRNLSTIEMAVALRKIEKSKLFDTREQLSQAIGKDPTYVGDLINTLKMDHRIIEHLAEFRSTDDVRLLRAIRRAYPAEKTVDTGENGLEIWESDKQWEFYRNSIIEGKMTREEVMDEIKDRHWGGQGEINIEAKRSKTVITLPFTVSKVIYDDIVAYFRGLKQ